MVASESVDNNAMNGPQFFVGVDIGARNSVVASSDRESRHCVTVDVNTVANRYTPTAVSFDGKVRLLGEEAESRLSANSCNTFLHFPMLLGATSESDIEAFRQRLPFTPDLKLIPGPNGISINVNFNNEDRDVPLEVVLAHYMRHLVSFAEKSRNNSNSYAACIALPASADETYTKQVALALKISNINNPIVMSRSSALLNCWCCRHLPSVFFQLQEAASGTDSGVPQSVCIALADVGFSETIIQIVRLELREDGAVQPTLLCCNPDKSIGVGDFMTAAALHVAEKIKQKHQFSFSPCSKKGIRFFNACSKAVTDLSGLGESSLDIESFLDDEVDLHYIITRNEFEDVCQPLKKRLEDLIKSTVQESGISKEEILGIDIVGGGSRIPWVAEVLETVSKPCIKDNSALHKACGVRHTLDGASSVAMGAAYFCAGMKYTSATDIDTYLSNISQERLDAALAVDKWITKVEKVELNRLDMRNTFESYILEMQGALNGPYKALLNKCDSQLDSYLKRMENWILDNEDASFEEYSAIFEHMKTELGTSCKEYFDAKESAKLKIEQDLVDNAKTKSMEMKEDMDVKLPNSQCIKKAKKNKDEGNELFKEGNCDLAVKHYIRALQYVAKMYDIAPQDAEEVSSLKLSLHLNLAQSYLKLSGNDTKSMGYQTFSKKAQSSASAALEIDANNIKALFRRALAHEKLGETDAAMADVQKALSFGDDADFQKLKDRLEQRLQREKEKEKKLYSRMFG